MIDCPYSIAYSFDEFQAEILRNTWSYIPDILAFEENPMSTRILWVTLLVSRQLMTSGSLPQM